MQIFTKNYWKESLLNFTKVKSIALMSILMGVCVVVGGTCSYFPVRIFDREMSLLFIFWPIIACLFGPIPTMLIAGLVDLLVFFLFPSGYPMYIGYTFTQMLIGLINGLFFYKSKISIIKLLLAKFIINFGIHVGIESLFMADISNFTFEAYRTFVIGGLVKNGIFLPIEVTIMVIVMGALLPAFRTLKICDEKYTDKVHLI